MILHLVRKWMTEESTIGLLYLNGYFECYTLEDAIRIGPKVYGKTAIPQGTYPVIVDHSQRFKRLMPHILEVPGFQGIRIHSGNTAEDTEGCILVGQTRGEDTIGKSRAAYDVLFAKIKEAFDKNENITIEIS